MIAQSCAFARLFPLPTQMSKTSKIVLGIIVIILIIWAISAGSKKAAINEPIKIGVIAPLSGPFAFYGEEMRRGILAAVGSSTQIKLIIEDEKCEPKDAVSVFQKLVNIDKVKFILGPGCGSPQEAIVPLLKEKNIFAMGPMAGSKELYANSGGNFYDAQYSLENESKYVADTLYRLGYKNAAILSYKNAFSETHAKSFLDNYKGHLALASVLLDYNVSSLSELTKIKALKADALYTPDASFFFGGGLEKMRQIGLNIPVYATYSAELPPLIPLTEGVRYSFPEGLGTDVGAVFGLSKDAANTLVPLVVECKEDIDCVKTKLKASGKFDEDGVSNRGMILKQIKGGKPVLVN